MYPILNLRYHKMDLHWFLRSLEEVIIRVLLSTFSIKASRIEGLTGVWVGMLQFNLFTFLMSDSDTFPKCSTIVIGHKMKFHETKFVLHLLFNYSFP